MEKSPSPPSSFSPNLAVGVVLVIVIILAAYFISAKNSGSDAKNAKNVPAPAEDQTALSKISIRTPQGVISALVADTAMSRERGLSGRSSLSADESMLFIFSDPGLHAFWMKDMRFSLDLVWIGADKKITAISRDVSPDSYPKIFLPPRPVSYVLELNAGAAQNFGLEAGAALIF